MTSNFRYTLETGSKKQQTCPKCGKPKTFVRYIDTRTGDHLPAPYGRCNREEHCGYSLNPYKDGYAKSVTDQGMNPGRSSVKAYASPKGTFKKQSEEPKPILIDNEILERTIKNGFEKNVFIQNLLHNVPYPFDPGDVQKVAQMYRLGTVVDQKSGRAGSITFPHIDEKGGCRAIQTRAYDLNNHSIKGGTDFIHTIIERHHKKAGTPLPASLEAYQNQSLKISCLFGAHLLPMYPTHRICIVEAPKTAIISTLYFGLPDDDDRLWLSATSRGSLTVDRCRAIQGRTVILYPDLSKDGTTFKLWQDKANEIMKALPGTRIVVSKMLEKIASSGDREKGYDLADYLIQDDWRKFRKECTPQQSIKPEAQPEKVFNQVADHVQYQPRLNFVPGAWDAEISTIDKYFEGNPIASGTILLNGIYPIPDIGKFLKANLEPARAQSGNPTYLPYLNRVKDLIKYLNSINQIETIPSREAMA